MEWHQIVGFYYTAKTGNFTKAAAITYRTQSALSQQIRKLEEELGVSLFERIGKRKLVITPAGEIFYEFAGSIMSQHNHLLNELSKLKGLQKGQLKIAAPFTSLNQLLPEKLEIYMKDFPWVEFTILDRSQKAVIELVREGEIDFGITTESFVPPSLNKIRWKEVETVLIINTSHPLSELEEITLSDIVKYPLILPARGNEPSKRTELENLFMENNLDYNMVMESSNVELNLTYVEMGLGISFATVVRNLPALNRTASRFISLSEYFEPEFLSVVYRKDKELMKHQQIFLDILIGEGKI